VTGCQHATVGGIVCGEFTATSHNHGRPVYRKNKQVNGLDVMLYFWDDRDGIRFSGWWFGPKVGGEQIWAYHPERSSPTPPATGWQVPYDGPVDPAFTVSLRFASGHHQGYGGHSGGGFSRRDEDDRRERHREVERREAERREADRREAERQRQREAERQRQREEDDRRRREDDRRRREEDDRRRREEEQRRRQEEQRRRDEDRRRQDEEARRRREEEQRRRAQEEEAKRQQQLQQDMEKKRLQQQVQQKAALAIRRVIQKVRSATVDTFDMIKKELEEILKNELDNTGPQKQRIWQESNEGLEQGRRRVEAEAKHRHALQVHQEQQRKEREAAAKRLEESKKLIEEQKRARMEENKRLIEETRKKQQEELEKRMQEAQQKREEEEKRKQEMQQKRLQENRAILEIRKAIQKLRIAMSREEEVVPDYDQLQASLEKALSEELDKTGSMKHQLQEESSQELEKLKGRLEKLQHLKEKKEEAAKIVEELEQRVQTAEASLQKLQETMMPLSNKSETTVKDIEQLMEGVQEATLAAQTAVAACSDSIREKAWEVKDWDLKQSLQKLQRRSTQTSQSVDSTIVKVQKEKDAAVRCALAWQKTREIQGIFFKYGTRDTLSRQEVLTYAKRELQYTVQDVTLDQIWGDLVPKDERGVKMEHFHLLKAAVGIARELERDKNRREEREEKDRVLKGMKADLQQKAKAAAFPVEEAAQSVDNVERQVNPLAAKVKTMPSSRMVGTADQTDRMIEEARACVEHAREHIENLGEDCGDRFKADIKSFLKAETKQLELKLGRMDLRLVRAANLSAQFRARVNERRTAELLRLKKVARSILRYNQGLRGLTTEELFNTIDVDGNGEIDEKEFVSFFETANKDIDMKDFDEDMAEPGASTEGEGTAQKATGNELGKAKPSADIDDGEAKELGREVGANEQQEEEGGRSEKAELAAAPPATVDDASGKPTTRPGDERHTGVAPAVPPLSTSAATEDAEGGSIGAAAATNGELADDADDEGAGQVDLSTESLSKLFAFILEEGSNTLFKDDFVQLIRVYYQVVKATAITSSRHISDSSTLRRLDVKEVVEVLEGPLKEGSADVKRIHARVMKDGLEGWITTSGNSGTVFLKEGGNMWKVVKETILTEAFDVGESREVTQVRETVRKLKPGELLQVYEWPRTDEVSGLTRMKAKVKSDGSMGWVTTVGNQGTTFAALA